MFVTTLKRITLYTVVCLGVMLFVGRANALEDSSFSGELDFLNKTFHILSDQSKDSFCEMKIQEQTEEGYTLLLKFNHFKTTFFDLSSIIKARVQTGALTETKDKVFFGELSSEYTLFDYTPIKELSGSFEIRDGKVVLNTVCFGKIVCNGTITIAYPYDLDLMFNLNEVEMAPFLRFWTQEPDPDASGLVSGEIKVSGPAEKAFLSGKLVSYDGHVDDLEFNKFFLNIQGVYPQMNILDSLVSQAEGMSFVFNGGIDLSSKMDFRKQVKALNIAPYVKDSGNQVEWTIKSSSQNDMGKMELKYLMRKDDDRGGFSEEGSDMLGIENTIEF